MLPNEPIDILAIASQRLHYWDSMTRNAMVMPYSEFTQQQFAVHWAQRCIAQDDMDAVQTLIRELSRTN